MPTPSKPHGSQLEFSLEYPLYPREKQVLALLADGKTRKEAAAALEISYWTARYYCDRAREKLRASTLTHAVVIYARNYCG